MNYAICEPITGKATGLIASDLATAELNTPDGYLLIENLLGNVDCYWDGVQLVATGIAPSVNHLFNYTTKQWEDPRSLQDFRVAKWTAIKQAREVAEFGPFVYNGMVFDGDVDAQRRLNSYISISKSALATGQAFEAVFTLADNTNVNLSAMDFVAIELAKVQQVAAAFAQASELRTQIEGTTSIDQLNLIQWTS